MIYKNLKLNGFEGDNFGDEGVYEGMWARDGREGHGVMKWSD